MSDKKGTAIVPGSFDPITYGHIDIVQRAASEYEKVYLAVMINNEKKYTFSITERTQIASVALSNIHNVEVIASEGMLWELARDLHADAIVKGYRNDIDLEYEKKMAVFNEERYPEAKTILLKASPDLENISSTAVRKKIISGEPLDQLLPDDVQAEINKILSKRK